MSKNVSLPSTLAFCVSPRNCMCSIRMLFWETSYPLHKERQSHRPSDVHSNNFPGQYVSHEMAFTRRTSWETKLSRFQKHISLKKRGRGVQRKQMMQVVTWKSCHFLNHILSFSWCIRVLNWSLFLNNYSYLFLQYFNKTPSEINTIWSFSYTFTLTFPIF